MNKKKLFIVTTIPQSLIFFKGQIQVLKNEFDVTLISSPEDLLYDTANHNSVASKGILMNREISILNDIVSLLKFVYFFAKTKPYIVHANTPKGSLLSLIAAWLCRVPNRLYFVHGLRYQGANGVKRKILMFMESLSCRFATKVFSVSKGVKAVLNKDGITKKPINIIWNGSINGIDTNYFNPTIIDTLHVSKKFNIKKDDFIFGFVGRIVSDKGINELVSAFKKINILYPYTKLMLVGGLEKNLDPLLPITQTEMNSNNNIFITGYQNDVRPYYKLMNVFVFPSYREGFGISLMEASAMKTPSISSNIIGCNEVITSNVNGFLIAPKSEVDLFNLMKFTLLNSDKLNDMALPSRDLVISKFKQTELWSQTLSALKKL